MRMKITLDKTRIVEGMMNSVAKELFSVLLSFVAGSVMEDADLLF